MAKSWVGMGLSWVYVITKKTPQKERDFHECVTVYDLALMPSFMANICRPLPFQRRGQMLTDILGLRFASLASQLDVEPGQRIYSLSYSDIDCVMLCYQTIWI